MKSLYRCLSRPDRLLNLCCLVLLLLVATRSAAAHATVNNARVEQAIANRICFEAFWWNRTTFKFGETVPIVVRDVDEKAYVWSERLSAVPNVKTWANFFSVFSSGDVVTVGDSRGYDADTLSGSPNFAEDRALVSGGPHSTLMFHVPISCTPKFEPPTPRKLLMLSVVEDSVAKELVTYRENGAANLPMRLKVVIANFNPDDPATAVLVPSAGYLFYVALHMASDPLSNTFLQQREFPVQPEYNRQQIAVISPKIEKYGIVRMIDLATR